MNDINYVFLPDQNNPFIVIDKPAGLPSAPLHPDDDSALTRAMRCFPQIKEVINEKKKIEYGLIHRIDTATRGLVLIAVSTDAWIKLQACQKTGKFKKWYHADIDYIPVQQYKGFPLVPADIKHKIESFFTEKASGEISFSLESKFRPFGVDRKAVRPVTSESNVAGLRKAGNKTYCTKVTLSNRGADCCISGGYRHQVRCHLAWVHVPITGDALYNPSVRDGQKLAFVAYKLSFPHPLTGNECTYILEGY
jgi:23S rRNA pseudouridine1911/1915/1917 synthase